LLFKKKQSTFFIKLFLKTPVFLRFHRKNTVAKKNLFATFYDFSSSVGAGFSLRKAGIKEKFLIPGSPCFLGLHGSQKVFCFASVTL
jgi:hypothetical protein